MLPWEKDAQELLLDFSDKNVARKCFDALDSLGTNEGWKLYENQLAIIHKKLLQRVQSERDPVELARVSGELRCITALGSWRLVNMIQLEEAIGANVDNI